MDGFVEVLWTLHLPPEGDIGLYVNALATDPLERELTQGQLPSETPLLMHGQEAVEAGKLLLREISGRTSPPEVSIRGQRAPLPAIGRLTHYATGTWTGTPVNQAVVKWAWEVPAAPSQSRVIELHSQQLSDAARRSIAVLDELALGIGRQRLDGILEQVLRRPVLERAPSRRVRLFISYRHTRAAEAIRLHNAFRTYGDATHFDPYLDQHDMRAGDLRSQLRDTIVRSDLFVPLCSTDYAEPGSISSDELGWARAEGDRRGLVLAPVVLDPRGAPHWPDWDRPMSLRVREDSDLDLQSEYSRRFAGACLRAVPVVDETPASQLVGAKHVLVRPQQAGQVGISGVVTDARSGRPLADVCVTLGPPITCAEITDADGRYAVQLPPVPGLSWELYYLRTGYRQAYSGVLRVTGPVVVDVRLAPL